MIIRPVKLTVCLTTSTTRGHKCFVFYYVVREWGFAPLYKYMVKYKALLVVDVVKLTVSLTGLIIMLTTPWHLA